jgi:acetyl/propionyl-CoA carboxylase alpha subunit
MGKERVLIANRGEIALRIIQACKDLGLDYVVLYTKEDEF